MGSCLANASLEARAALLGQRPGMTSQPRHPPPVGALQAYHRLHMQLQRRLHGHTRIVGIKPLNEAAAVATAADVVGELSVFGVAGALVVLEVSRSAAAERRREAATRHEKEVSRRPAQLHFCMRPAVIAALQSLAFGTFLPWSFSRTQSVAQPSDGTVLQALRQRDCELQAQLSLLQSRLASLEDDWRRAWLP